MANCCKCGDKIQEAFFNSDSGKIYAKCLIEMQVYYAPDSLGLIRIVEEGDGNGEG